MHPSIPLIISFLSLLLFINISQGIRLEEHSLKSFYMKSKVVSFSGGERKLMQTKSSEDHSEVKSMEVHVEKQIKEHGHLPTKTYTDELDIAEMDYSPAKRKPPIHN
ncbi:uncharacterized protein LOC120257186 [Dioscorea cayenensis subsp. rotundata]|uniref:Uncharacterized protein LOC120257186 n=1 Tax=Dioscorea cayennensis subsp. rotundata TaxID=55577 RepID=A0AB40B0C1_DIOCR|nr:uncharacterized protein LOC120257186 [Dioscorea cayenensis subsp. rotundata]